MKKEINVGIGFATGRRGFQKVLKMNVYNWRECGLIDKDQINLNLFIAYDLKYSNTKSIDYTNISDQVENLVDSVCFIGAGKINEEIEHLISEQVLTASEAALFFQGGYAAKRNAILYLALKNKMDYLIYLDDDEYPMAVTNSANTVLWGGQHVLSTHLQHIKEADVTNGYHCGYISPVPQIKYNDVLSEADFKMFIESISNDIINWTTISKVMANGGVTFADKDLLISQEVEEVQEVGGAKFISGSNLCVNLQRRDQIQPFYNPPNARGEDTFLSTCLSDSRVLRVPCYTFHDAFSMYRPLMDGVLPIALKPITSDSERANTRFLKACIGWVRYKPLLMYITQPEVYEERIAEMQRNLAVVLPKLCEYFGDDKFMKISGELLSYHKKVKDHYRRFQETKNIWTKLQQHLAK